MKHIIALVTALLLLLVPTALGEGSRLLKLDDSEYLNGMLAADDTLVLVGDEKLYTWREGDAELTAWENGLRLPASDDGGEAYLYAMAPYAREGGLSAVALAYNDDYEPTGLCLFDIAFEDGAAMAENVRELPLPAELSGLEYFHINTACEQEGRLVMLIDEDGGMELCVLDPDNPQSARFERLDGWDNALLPTADGALLVQRDYQTEASTLCRVMPDGSLEALGELPLEARSVAADPATGALYAVVSGLAYSVEPATGELGEPIAALPVRPQYGAVLGDPGLYAVTMEGGVALLDTGARLQRDAVLTVGGAYSPYWLRQALVEYATLHPELPVSMGDGDTSPLDDMMKRSGDTDIYIMNCSMANDYFALLDRGYMLPLDSSEALSKLAARMYPGLLDGLSSGGRLAALPLAVNASGMAVDEELLEQLGLSADALPRDWAGFLDLLDALAERVDALPEGARFTYDEMTASGFRFYLRIAALQQFAAASQAAGRISDYEDPRLVEVLERLDAMDFSAFGLPGSARASDSEEEGYGYSWGGDTRYLIQLDAEAGFATTDLAGTTLLLGFGDDLPGVLPADLYAAFVNPYSAHADEAVAFLEALVERLPAETQYALFPDLDEPLRQPDAEATIEQYEDNLARAKAELEAAQPEDRQLLEDDIGWIQRDYDLYLRRGVWLIPREKLDWYRANADRVTVARPSWFQKDDSGEAWELLEQYDHGLMTAREFLAAVNQKARMMELEG